MEVWDGLGDFDGKTFSDYITIAITFIDFALLIISLMLMKNSVRHVHFRRSFNNFLRNGLQLVVK